MDKILTISIAAYNIENYIEKALNSILGPSINDKIEILVCDDGGTDGTLSIVQKYAEKYPGTVVPIHKKNEGYGSVYNTNIARATGKYFKVLDGDDWFVKENFISFVELLSRIDVDYVVTDAYNFYESSGTYSPIRYCSYIPEGIYDFNQVEFREAIGMNGSTYRTSILKTLPKPISQGFYVDSELVLYSVPYINAVYFWHHEIYVYQHGRSEASTSKATVMKYYKVHEDVFWNIFEVYQNLDESHASKLQFARNYIVFFASEFYKFHSYSTPSKENYREMCNFRDKLKERCPEIIPSAKKKSHLVWLFFTCGVLAYPFMHFLRIAADWLKETGRKKRKTG